MGRKADGSPQNAHGRGCAWQLPNGTWRCRVQMNRKTFTGAGKSETAARAEMNRKVRAQGREEARVENTVAHPPMPTEVGPNGKEFARIDSPSFRRWIYLRDNGLCGICHKRVDWTELHVDHIRPRSEGGTNQVSNLRCTHGACNMRRARERLEPVYV